MTTTSLGQNARLTFSGTAGQRISVTSSNNTISGSTFSVVKPDNWNFAGNAGQQATVHVTGKTIGYTGVTLRKPYGGSLTSLWWWDRSFNLQTQTLPTTGTYKIEVDPSWGATGNIAVSVTSP